MQLTEVMLQAAMRKAREHGLLPRCQSEDRYTQNLAAVKDILHTTLEVADKEMHAPLAKVAALTGNMVRSDYAVFRSGNRANYVPGIISKQQ